MTNPTVVLHIPLSLHQSNATFKLTWKTHYFSTLCCSTICFCWRNIRYLETINWRWNYSGKAVFQFFAKIAEMNPNVCYFHRLWKCKRNSVPWQSGWEVWTCLCWSHSLKLRVGICKGHPLWRALKMCTNLDHVSERTKLLITVTLFPLTSAKFRSLSQKKLFPAYFCPLTAIKTTSLEIWFNMIWENYCPIWRTDESGSIVTASITLLLCSLWQ
jgi:hypothetical protein